MEAHAIPPTQPGQKPPKPPFVVGSSRFMAVLKRNNGKVIRLCAVFLLVTVLVLGYMFLGSEAIVRRGQLGLGERQVLKTANGHVGQKKYDAIVAALKYYGHKDTADSKTGLPAVKEGAQKMLASEGYLENIAKKNKMSLPNGALDAQLKQRYGTKTGDVFYRQYKNPDQMAVYFETEAKMQVYKTLLQSKLLKGKQATLITVRQAGMSSTYGKLNNAQANTALTAVKKDMQDNLRPLLRKNASLTSMQESVKTKKLNTGGVLVVPAPVAVITNEFYPTISKTPETALSKLIQNTVTIPSIIASQKVGDISPVTQLTLGNIVVVRYDADLSSNPFNVWTDMTPVAAKESKFY